MGRTLGDFVVREVIGGGAMGEVYRAEQATLQREAVIKVMRRAEQTSPTAIQRFLREARLASQLDHPYAAHVYAFGAEPDGLLWIAMELVRGTTLQQTLELQGPITVERFVPLLEKICQVVHTAHEQGIVHRDIKPANVMIIARAGQLLPKLLDLGVAKTLLDDEPRADADLPASTEEAESFAPMTQDAIGVGSPPYMAPEQWIHAASAGTRADIYSLGVLSYEALTGKTPFRSKTLVGMARAHATKPVPALGDGFPPALDEAIARAMAKTAASRFPDALSLATAVRAAALPDPAPIPVPKLDAAILRPFIDGAPQPLAEAAAALDAALNPRQARDALWALVRLLARMLGIYALASRTRVGAGGDGDAPEVVEALQALKRRGLSDVEWLDLARALAKRFVAARDAHPLPELVALFFDEAGVPTDAASLLRDLAARSGAGTATAAEAEVAQQLAPIVADLERVIGALGFIATYPLAIARGGVVQRWSGARRVPRAQLAGGSRLQPDRPALVDPAGVPVVSLWPLVQVAAPTPAAGDELFVFEGPGARGARLLAPPFEHMDDGVWDWFRDHLSQSRAAATRAVGDDTTPYLGLATFTSRDAAVFFGREREAELVANRLRVCSLVAIVGPSGAGKSSFVQAGVLPILPAEWQSIVLRPGPTPLAALAARMTNVDPAKTLVIVVDQFEELITLCREPNEREAFVGRLVTLAPSVDAPVRVIVTLRDDFLMRAEQLPGLRQAFAGGLTLLGMPSRDDLVRILVEPGRRAGYELEDPELAREMIDAVADRPGALPLLSFTAARLWELRDRHFHQLPRKAYAALGGVGGALAQHAEATLTGLVPDEQRLCREAFRHLVTADGTRAVMTRSELEQVMGASSAARVVVDRLVDARLLVTSEDETGTDRIEIVHETLIQAWPRLLAWRHEDAEGARLRDQLRQAARQWHERKRPRGMLWRAEALAEFRIWRARHAGSLTETEDAFARASDADEARGRRIRRTITVGGFAALVVALAILYRANQRAEDERVAAEAASTQSATRLADSHFDRGRQYVLAGDPMRAFVYLTEAARLGVRDEASAILVAQAVAPIESVERVLAGHRGKVWVARYSPDGASIATAGEDGVVRLWNASTGALVHAFEGHSKDIVDLAFRPDGRALASASFDGTARLWELPSYRALGVLAHDADVFMVRFSPDGALLATSSFDRHARLWNAIDGTLVAKLGPLNDKAVVALFSPDGTQLVTTTTDGGAAVWDVRSHQKLHDLVGHSLIVFGAAWSPDGKRLVTSAWDHVAIIWDAARGTRLATLAGHAAEIDQVAWSPDGERIATASRDGTARIWAASDGRLERTLVGHRSYINSIVFSRDSERVLTASSDGTAKLWAMRVGSLIASFDGHATAVYRASFSPDEQHVLTASWDATARLWRPTRGALVATLQQPVNKRRGPVVDAELCGDRAITAGDGNAAWIWNRETGRMLVELAGHTGALATAACDARGIRAVTASQDKTARLWDVATGKPLATLASSDELVAARFAADGRIATAAAHGEIAIWDAAGARLATITAGAPLVDVAWSDDQKLVLARSAHEAIVVDTSTQSIIARPSIGTANLTAARFVAGAPYIALGSDDKHARLVDARTGRVVRDFAHDAIVLAVRGSPDGSLLAVAVEDGHTAIWNVATGERLGSLSRHNGEVEDVVFAADSRIVATAGTEGTVKVWDATTMRELASFASNLGSIYQLAITADGRRILARDDAGGVFVWRLDRDHRDPQALARAAGCYVPLGLHENRLTPVAVNTTTCLARETASPSGDK